MKELEKISKKLLLNDINKIPIDTVIGEYKTPGTYTLTIPVDGIYEIYCIAPGGESYITGEGLYVNGVE